MQDEKPLSEYLNEQTLWRTDLRQLVSSMCSWKSHPIRFECFATRPTAWSGG